MFAAVAAPLTAGETAPRMFAAAAAVVVAAAVAAVVVAAVVAAVVAVAAAAADAAVLMTKVAHAFHVVVTPLSAACC